MFNILPLCLGTFALGIDAYIMAGLLPGIGSSFNVPASVAGQTVTIFTACYAITAPLFGALTAGKPVRRVLGVALVLFILANVLSATASGFSTLLVSRAAAGLGAGLYSPIAFSAAASMVSPSRRGRRRTRAGYGCRRSGRSRSRGTLRLEKRNAADRDARVNCVRGSRI
ncbi:MFS transporter [Paraburkholderia sp. GAS334]|uniref:MFS transporter n=1 Tax=Paraburkholderia sp. GAS334 TaxID=3035131 RepID=UPI003D1FC031